VHQWLRKRRRNPATWTALCIAASPILALGGDAAVGEAAAQVTGARADIEAPAHVEVGDAFTAAVRYAIDPAQAANLDGASLVAGLYGGAACPQASVMPVVALTAFAGMPFAAQEQRVEATVDGDIAVGEYSVCTYLVTDAQPTSLLTRSSVTVDPVRPTAQRPWTITMSRFAVRRVGPLSFDRVSAPVLDFYYGERSRKSSGRGGCRAAWPSVGVTATFYNLGAGSGPCGEDGRIDSFSIGGTQRDGLVRTSAGLKLGDSVAQIRRRYRHARRHGANTWWLRTAHSPFAGGFRYAVLAAKTRGRRISGFVGFVGGAGE
jgi:hypothetical protein